jgi:hypothetical protein
MSDPTLAGAELPQNRGRSRPESNPLDAILVTEDKGVVYVKARFVFIPPRIEDFCTAGAVRYLRSFWGEDADIPAGAIHREKAMLMISYGLRREDDPTRSAQVYPWPQNAFNASTGEWNLPALRTAAIRDQCPNVDELWQEYQLFRESEFPPAWKPDQWRALVAAGKSQSLETLLSSHGFLPILRALPGLAAAYRTSSPTTGTAGRP